MTRLQKMYEVLQWASSFLRKYNREEIIAEILLQHHLQLSRAQFYNQMQAQMDEDIQAAFRRDILQIAQHGVPVQHLIGKTNFYGRDFKVGPDVLIPRFETEELVETVITDLEKTSNKGEGLILADIGTGSGVIAITLKLELPGLTVVATDISEKALHVASANAKDLHADVQFYQGNFLTPLVENKIKPQIVVANPPYIAHEEREGLSDMVKNFDPPLALFADENGLASYHTIAAQATMFHTIKKLYFEIGYQQAKAVTSIIKEKFPSALVKTKKDMADKERIIRARL